jgi:hypothetical protein
MCVRVISFFWEKRVELLGEMTKKKKIRSPLWGEAAEERRNADEAESKREKQKDIFKKITTTTTTKQRSKTREVKKDAYERWKPKTSRKKRKKNSERASYLYGCTRHHKKESPSPRVRRDASPLYTHTHTLTHSLIHSYRNG